MVKKSYLITDRQLLLAALFLNLHLHRVQ